MAMEMSELYYGNNVEPTWIRSEDPDIHHSMTDPLHTRLHSREAEVPFYGDTGYSRFREISDSPYYPETLSRSHFHEVSPYSSNVHLHNPARQILPGVQLMVPMCCEKCEEKIREELMELDGALGVVCDTQLQKVTVTGLVDPLRALKKAKRVKRKSQFWPSTTLGQILAPPLAPPLAGLSRQYEGDDYMLAEESRYHHDRHFRHHDSTEYRTSYNEYTPSYGQSYTHSYEPSYRNSYNPSIITNPYYMKHIESEH